MSNKCLGCGAIKQTDNKEKVGYIKDLTHKYCYECFSLMHYGKTQRHFHPDSYNDIKKDSHVLIIASTMQLDLLFTLPIEKIQSNAKYTYIINKVDLLPKETNLDHLINEISKKALESKIKYEDIILMSAVNNNDINNLKDYINNLSSKDIYLFGYQNSGKSTIYKNLTNDKDVLNLNKVGLTQEIITNKLGNKLIHDVPGDFVKGNLADLISYEQYKKLLPAKTIKPKMYFITNNQKLFINDFIEIKVLTKSNPLLVLYLNEFNKLNKYNINNDKDNLNILYEYTNKTFKLNKDTKQTISIADFLFINIQEEATIQITYPKKLKLTIMESLLK